MASDEKRSWLDELINLDENGRRHIFSHSTLATDARHELEALRAENEVMRALMGRLVEACYDLWNRPGQEFESMDQAMQVGGDLLLKAQQALDAARTALGGSDE